MSRYAIILPAAGKSTRFGDPFRKKVFVDLQGRPVWVRTVQAFLSRDDVAQVILAIAADDISWFREKFAANLAFMNTLDVVTGGAERVDTVEAALARVRPEVDFIAVHDAARPLISGATISAVFAAAAESGAAILATPVSSTVKRVTNGGITGTVDRSQLWLAQTPQVFRRELLLRAYAQRQGTGATDDAQLVEAIGHPVTVVEGSPLNLKITTQDDLRMAQQLLPLIAPDNPLTGMSGRPHSDPKPGLW